MQCNGLSSSGALATVIAQPNTNYDLVFTYDGTAAKVFVNGALAGSATKTFNHVSSVTKITIGAGKLLSCALCDDGAETSVLLQVGTVEQANCLISDQSEM